ncbi:MAG TPA: MarR family transcriptional regulator [Trebonia sp.]
MRSTSSDGDDIDLIVEQWHQERPDLDLSALGVLGRIAKLTAVLTPAVEAVFARHQLSQADFDVLSTLRRAGSPYVLMPSQLSSALMMSRTGMTGRLDRLERRGLVERTLDPADRRSFRISLTERGLTLIDRVMEDHAANLAKIMAPMTQRQIAMLEAELKNLLHAVSVSATSPAGPTAREGRSSVSWQGAGDTEGGEQPLGREAGERADPVLPQGEN